MTQLARTSDAELREAIFRYSMEQASPAFQGHIQHLCSCWVRYNDEFFAGELAPTVIGFEEPGYTNCYGEHSTVSMFGGSGQILIRPSLLAGTLQHFKEGNRNKEGLRRFTEHVLLHEMIHQWQHEVARVDHGEFYNYGGHGDTFSAKANEIGVRLGYPPVRKRNKKSHSGDTAHLPNPSRWPHNVCPHDYYLGAYVPASRDIDEELRIQLGRLLQRHGMVKVERTAREVWERMKEHRRRAAEKGEDD
jgi:hypothetical protein